MVLSKMLSVVEWVVLMKALWCKGTHNSQKNRYMLSGSDVYKFIW